MESLEAILKNLLSSNKISSSLFAIIFYISILYIGSFLEPTIYPFIDRVTYSTPFVKYFIDPHYDSIIVAVTAMAWFLLSFNGRYKYHYFLVIGFTIVSLIILKFPIYYETIAVIPLPIISFLLLYDKYSKKNLVQFDFHSALKYLSFGAIILGILGLFTTVYSIISPTINLPSINYGYYIFLIFSLFTPFFIVIISFYYPLSILFQKLSGKKDSKHTKQNNDSLEVFLSNSNQRKSIHWLLLLIVFSIGIAAIPHVNSNAENNNTIGSDSNDYVNMLKALFDSNSVAQFLDNSFSIQSNGDRPVSLIILFTLITLIGHSKLYVAVDYIPMFLSPILLICNYLLVIELTQNRRTALFASFLTITAFQIPVGTYAGFYANWIALIFGSLTILFLIKYIRLPTFRKLFLYSICMILILLSHAPTWVIFGICIAIFLLISIKSDSERKRSFILILIASLPSLIIDMIRLTFTNSSGIVSDISFAQSEGIGFQNAWNILTHLDNTLHISVGGLFANPIVYGLILYFIFKARKTENIYSIFLIFFTLLIPPMLIGNVDILTRALYEMPFQVPAAIGLTLIRNQHGKVMTSAICIWLVMIALRNFSNFSFMEFQL